MPDPAINPHDQAEALLPWYATGQLEGDERALVERHLATCLPCQRQLRFDHRMTGEFEHLDPQIESGWARLRARLDKESEPRKGWRSRPGAWDIVKRPAVATLVAAQLAFVVVAGGVLLSLDRPQYQALGSPAPAAAAANVIVVFHADATQRDIVGILRASGASLVGGPTAADAYLLRVPADRRDAALATLQADEDVQLAEPIDGAAQ
ncbi:zf-HC2 domain-containing protein [Sphingomonas sp. URHD0057]|uniref:zf-HC2 domain-containing protein n=1 Tax=Sphingomonas sp. URHD0057 TaxID=1380389 RepID=UPI00048B2933|nr:zf-HC2 domain-containing protein [Sphingomonas sp. URHD0057]